MLGSLNTHFFPLTAGAGSGTVTVQIVRWPLGGVRVSFESVFVSCSARGLDRNYPFRSNLMNTVFL